MQLITFQTIAKFFLLSVLISAVEQKKDTREEKSAFFPKSTTLSASFELRWGFLWKSQNPIYQTLITTLGEQLITF